MKAEVRSALAAELGESLLQVNGAEIDGRVASVPDVRSVRFDRAFPHTLKIVVKPERPVLLLRRGKDSWSVSARGRVLRSIHNPGLSSLPRMWVPLDTQITVGGRLAPATGGVAAAALAPLRGGLLSQVRFVRTDGRELTLVLRSGPRDPARRPGRPPSQARGRAPDPGDARHRRRPSGYLDVSVPERPVVSSNNSQVGS